MKKFNGIRKAKTIVFLFLACFLSSSGIAFSDDPATTCQKILHFEQTFKIRLHGHGISYSQLAATKRVHVHHLAHRFVQISDERPHGYVCVIDMLQLASILREYVSIGRTLECPYVLISERETP